MDTEDAGRRGGIATAAAMTADERKIKSLKMLAARWQNVRADRARAARLKARKKGRIAAASRKANRA